MRVRIILLLGLALLYVSVVALYHALSAEPIRDEHQFMAGAFLIADQGMLPYRDFAYFHLPNLSYLQSLVFRFGDHPFLSARLLSAAASVALVVAVFLASYALKPGQRYEQWIVVSLSVAIMFANTKLYADAAAFVWNHAPSALASLLAFIVQRRAMRRGLSVPLSGLSGFLLGSAIGFRLTALPLVLPFVAALLLAGGVGSKQRAWAVSVFAGAGLLANLPALLALFSSPDSFWFGNLGYPRLNTLYRRELGYEVGMTLLGKLELALTEVVLRVPELLLASAVLLSLTGRRPSSWLQVARARPDFLLLLSLTPFALAGALAPTPAFGQYFIGPAVFVVLLAPYGLSCFQSQMVRTWGTRLLAAGALSSVLYGGIPKSRSSLELLAQPGSWAPMRLHVQGAQIAERMSTAAGDPILTLAPAHVVEFGHSIYPEFAAGPFGWRVGHLMSPADRQRFGIVSPADLDRFLEIESPSTILTGLPQVGFLDEPLARAARERGYREEVLSDVMVLWFR